MDFLLRKFCDKRKIPKNFSAIFWLNEKALADSRSARFVFEQRWALWLESLVEISGRVEALALH